MPTFNLYAVVILAMCCVAANCSINSASASSGAGSASDGTSHTYTGTSTNGQGTFTSTLNGQPGPSGPLPGAGFGAINDRFGANPGYYGPSNFYQNGFGTYGAGFGYTPFPNQVPPYTPFVPSSPFGFQAPFSPQPLLTPEQFNQQLSQYLSSLQQQYANLYKRQQDFISAWRDAQAQSYYGPGPNYAYATGSYGPNGIHQTAGVNPPNKDKPNVDSRFGEESTARPANKPGYFGISTGSFSSSSDINGVQSHKQGAITTVDDNGKVTSYKVES